MESDKKLGRVLWQAVASEGREARFDRGDTLFHQGEGASTLHLVLTGRVAIRLLTEEGNTVTVDIAAPGDILGELALLTPEGTRAATAVALEPVTTCAIDRRHFDEIRRRSPAVGDLLVELLADRVRNLDERLTEALYYPADVRVVRRLHDLVDVYGRTVPLRQEDLADLAGTTRATVNRVLRRLERDQVVSLSRARIRIVDDGALDVARRPRPPRP